MKIFDITQELFTCKVYPGDRAPAFERVKTVSGDNYNLTDVSLCVHNGTHADAPSHFIANGKTIDELPPDIFYGACTVVSFSGLVGEKEIAGVLADCHDRLLLKGDCEITEEAARTIAMSHVRLIGVESQSVGNVAAPMSVHLVLLEKEVIPLEGLDLSTVTAGDYVLSALPLKLGGCEGAPVRAILIQND